MAQASNKELVKRIAKLVKQNQELEDTIKRMDKEYEKLSASYERLKSRAGAAADREPEKRETS